MARGVLPGQKSLQSLDSEQKTVNTVGYGRQAEDLTVDGVVRTKGYSPWPTNHPIAPKLDGPAVPEDACLLGCAERIGLEYQNLLDLLGDPMHPEEALSRFHIQLPVEPLG